MEQTAGKVMFDLFDSLYVRTDDFGVENEGNLESLHFSHRIKTFQLAASAHKSFKADAQRTKLMATAKPFEPFGT